MKRNLQNWRIEKMTITEKQHTNKHYYISMDMINDYKTDGEIFWYYRVDCGPRLSDGTIGYPIRSMVYSLDERKNALATFNRYKRTYQ